MTSLFFRLNAASESVNPLTKVREWFILLGYDPSAIQVERAKLSHYDMAILDPDSHPPFSLFNPKTMRIAYLSVGEAEVYRSYWERIKDESWILGENPNWEGNYYVDIREKAWRRLILEEVIPKIVGQGFQGVMLDTLDTAEFLETEFQYPGSYQAMIQLVRDIREKYPGLLLISNNGFSILRNIAPWLSGLLVEDIYSMPDFENGGYVRVPEADRQYKIAMLQPLMKQYGLPVFNIEYVDRRDKKLAVQCIKSSKKLGFIPYVAEKNLSEFSPVF